MNDSTSLHSSITLSTPMLSHMKACMTTLTSCWHNAGADTLETPATSAVLSSVSPAPSGQVLQAPSSMVGNSGHQENPRDSSGQSREAAGTWPTTNSATQKVACDSQVCTQSYKVVSRFSGHCILCKLCYLPGSPQPMFQREGHMFANMACEQGRVQNASLSG